MTFGEKMIWAGVYAQVLVAQRRTTDTAIAMAINHADLAIADLRKHLAQATPDSDVSPSLVEMFAEDAVSPVALPAPDIFASGVPQLTTSSSVIKIGGIEPGRGWAPIVQMLRQHSHFGLVECKRIVDTLRDGHPISFTTYAGKDFNTIARELRSVGCLGVEHYES